MMQLDAEKLTHFRRIFLAPSIAAMHALNPEDFELFVSHVFTCARHTVDHVAGQRYPEGTGVDLDLYVPATKGSNQLRARVEVRRLGQMKAYTTQQ